MEVECDNCGETTDKRPSKIDRNDHLFCSRECYHEFGRPDMKGDDNPNPSKSKVAVTCEWCGDDFQVYPYRADSARFCSRECSDDAKTAVTGSDAARWNGGKPEHECLNCGDTFRRYDTPGRDNDYCSKSCYRKASEEIFAGEGNPAWRGGYDGYYGPNWTEQRRAAIIRDRGRCQDCGKPESGMSRGANVHHKTRLGWYKEEYDAPEWWQKANVLDNLVTLCPACHKKREWSDANTDGE